MESVGLDLYICTNEKSLNYMEYTGLCCDDECEDGERWEE